MSKPTQASQHMINPNTTSNKAEALRASLLSMIDKGMQRYDPARFHYIQTLLDKATQVSVAIADILCMKADKARDRYETDLKRSLESVAKWTDEATRLSPGSKPTLDALLSRYEIRLARQMARKIIERHEAKSRPNLGSLFKDDMDVDDKPPLSLEIELLNHEATVQQLHSLDHEPEDVTERYQFSDLKSYQLFKETSVKLHADHLVAQAIDEIPKNAGPLNSHRLAVNSIEMMKDLSPAYLRRFVSYMDTLLWLEKANNISSKPASKRGRSKKL